MWQREGKSNIYCKSRKLEANGGVQAMLSSPQRCYHLNFRCSIFLHSGRQAITRLTLIWGIFVIWSLFREGQAFQHASCQISYHTTYRSKTSSDVASMIFSWAYQVVAAASSVSLLPKVEAISPNPVGQYPAILFWTDDGKSHMRQVRNVWARMAGSAENPVEESVSGHPIMLHDYSRDDVHDTPYVPIIVDGEEGVDEPEDVESNVTEPEAPQPGPEPAPEPEQEPEPGRPGEAEMSNPDSFVFDGPEDAFPQLTGKGPLLSNVDGIPTGILGDANNGHERSRRLDHDRQQSRQHRQRIMQTESDPETPEKTHPKARYEYLKLDPATGALVPSGVAVVKGIDPPKGMFPKHVLPIPVPSSTKKQQVVSSTVSTSSTNLMYMAPTDGETGENNGGSRTLAMANVGREETDERAAANKGRISSTNTDLETSDHEASFARIPAPNSQEFQMIAESFGFDETNDNPSTTFPVLVVPILFANHEYPASTPEEVPSHISGAAGRKKDLKKRWIPTQSQLNKLFNGDENDMYSSDIDVGTGTLRLLMEQLSHGHVHIEARVLDWIPVQYEESYYAAGQRGYGTKSRIEEAIVEALDYLDMDYHINLPDSPPIDLKQYDLDKDGVIDPGHVLFLHSGYGSECGGIAEDDAYFMDRIWSHTSLLLKKESISNGGTKVIRGDSGAGWASTAVFDEEKGVYDVKSVVRVPCYSIVSAAHGTHFFRKNIEERIVRVGVLAHELISQMLLGLMESQYVIPLEEGASPPAVDEATYSRSNAANWDFTSLGGEGAWGFGAGDQTCVSPLNPLTRMHLGWLGEDQVQEITSRDVNDALESVYNTTGDASIYYETTTLVDQDVDGLRLTLKPTTLDNAIIYKVSDGLAVGEYLLLEYRRRRRQEDYCDADSKTGKCDEESARGNDIGMGLEGCLPVLGGLAIWHVKEETEQAVQDGTGEGDSAPPRPRVSLRLLQSDESGDLERGFNTGDSGDLFTPHKMGLNDQGATHLFIAPTGKVLTFQKEMVEGVLQVVEDPMATSKFMSEMGIPVTMMSSGQPRVESDEGLVMMADDASIAPTAVGVWLRDLEYKGPNLEEMTFKINFESFEDGGGLDFLDGNEVNDLDSEEGGSTVAPAVSSPMDPAAPAPARSNSPTLHPTGAPVKTLRPTPAPVTRVPTPDIERSCQGLPNSEDMALFQVQITTDLNGSETWWELVDAKRGPTLWHVEGPYEDGISKQFDFQGCLPKKTCWSWILHDSAGNGLDKGEGGSYRVMWDGELVDRLTLKQDRKSPQFYEFGLDFGSGCMNGTPNWRADASRKPEFAMRTIGDMRASGIMFNIHAPTDWPSPTNSGVSSMVLQFQKMHLSQVIPGTNDSGTISMNVYTKNGSYEGYETNPDAWTLTHTLTNIAPRPFQYWTHTVEGGFLQSQNSRGLKGVTITKGTTQAFYIEVTDPIPPDANDRISDVSRFKRNEVLYVNDCIGRVDMKEKGIPNQIDRRFENAFDVYSGTMVLPNFGGVSDETKKSSIGDSTACVEVVFRLYLLDILELNEEGEYPPIFEDRLDGLTNFDEDWLADRDRYYSDLYDPQNDSPYEESNGMEGTDEKGTTATMETQEDYLPSGLDFSRGAESEQSFLHSVEDKSNPRAHGLIAAHGLKAKLIATSGQMVQFDVASLPINKNNVTPLFHSSPSGATCIPLYNTTKLKGLIDERGNKEEQALLETNVASQHHLDHENSDDTLDKSNNQYYEDTEEMPDESLLSSDDFLIGWAYVSNSESEYLDVTGGGVGALIFDTDGNLIDYYMALTGSNNNAGGGMTPWGTWLSCEEDGNVGFIYEVDVQRVAAPKLLHHLQNKIQGNGEPNVQKFTGRETSEIPSGENVFETDGGEEVTPTLTCLGEGGGNFHSVAYDARNFNTQACTEIKDDGMDLDAFEGSKNCHLDFFVSVDAEWSVIRKYTPKAQIVRDSYLRGSVSNILRKDASMSFEESCGTKRNGPLLYVQILSVTKLESGEGPNDTPNSTAPKALAEGTFEWIESRQDAQLSWSSLDFPFTEKILFQDGKIYVRSKVVPNEFLILNVDELTWTKQYVQHVLDSIYRYQVYESPSRFDTGPFLSSNWRSWHHLQPNEALNGLAVENSHEVNDPRTVHDLMFFTQGGSYSSLDEEIHSVKDVEQKEKKLLDASSTFLSSSTKMNLSGVYARDETNGGILLPLLVVKNDSVYHQYSNCGANVDNSNHGDTYYEGKCSVKVSGLALSPDQKHLYVAFQNPGHIWEITREDGQILNGQVLGMSTQSASFDLTALSIHYVQHKNALSETESNEDEVTTDRLGNSTGTSNSSSQLHHNRRRRDMRRHLQFGNLSRPSQQTYS